MTNQKSVSGVFSLRCDVENAVQELKDAGYSMVDISVLIGPKSNTDTPAPSDPTEVADGTAAGLIAGGTLGGVLGLLAGIGSFAIPGLGTFVAAGPLLGTLTGIGAGGVVGVIAGSLIGFGIPKEQSLSYEGHIRRGGILLAVRLTSTEEEEDSRQILEILNKNGAEEVSLQETWPDQGAVVDGGSAGSSW